MWLIISSIKENYNKAIVLHISYWVLQCHIHNAMNCEKLNEWSLVKSEPPRQTLWKSAEYPVDVLYKGPLWTVWILGLDGPQHSRNSHQRACKFCSLKGQRSLNIWMQLNNFKQGNYLNPSLCQFGFQWNTSLIFDLISKNWYTKTNQTPAERRISVRHSDCGGVTTKVVKAMFSVAADVEF